MNITINGQSKTVEDQLSVAGLIQSYCPKPELVIGELNGIILNRQLWRTTFLKPHDRIELVTMVGGG